MIKALNISKTYRQGKARIEALKSATLEIKRGESALISGPSGAGKSTLLHLLGGLDRPTGGKLFFDGVDFYGLSDRERSAARNGKAGFVFQFYHLLPEFTVLENVILPALIGKLARRSRKDITARGRGLLKMVGLEKRSSHIPSELSGGESQRAAIARALINRPEILLCDEPTGNLDSGTGGEIKEILRRLKDKENMALAVVTHQERMDLDFDKKFVMRDGMITSNEDASGMPGAFGIRGFDTRKTRLGF